jgi:voltage-gated potassium channel Kch
LAGLVFGVAFHLVDGLQPGSFRFTSDDGTPGQRIDIGTAIYFSFVTLATLGYGDVVPVTPPARSLATLEAVGAQMYLAVLIARLVSLHANRSERAD